MGSDPLARPAQQNAGTSPKPMVVDRPVSAVMSAPVLSVRRDSPLQDAVQLMRVHHVSGLPVVGEQGELVLRPDTLLDGPSGVLWTSASHNPLRNAAGDIIGTLTVVRDITARKLAEQALRESEENLLITLQSIGDAVIATDAAGAITRMNPVAERMTGWSLADALGRPLGDVFPIVHSDTRLPAPDPVQQVLASGDIVGLANHTALLARDGSERHIADSAAPIRNSQGRIVGVVLVFSDV
jgi:PAS domain S-box-containing protein